MSEQFENAVMDAIAALSRAVYAIHTDGRPWDHNIEKLAEAIEGLNHYLDATRGTSAKIIHFPKPQKPEGGQG